MNSPAPHSLGGLATAAAYQAPLPAVQKWIGWQADPERGCLEQGLHSSKEEQVAAYSLPAFDESAALSFARLFEACGLAGFLDHPPAECIVCASPTIGESHETSVRSERVKCRRRLQDEASGGGHQRLRTIYDIALGEGAADETSPSEFLFACRSIVLVRGEQTAARVIAASSPASPGRFTDNTSDDLIQLLEISDACLPARVQGVSCVPFVCRLHDPQSGSSERQGVAIHERELVNV